MLLRAVAACVSILVSATALGTTPVPADPIGDCAQASNLKLRISACSDLIVRAKRRSREDRRALALTYRRRGSAFLETGQPIQAMADFTEAISLKPGYVLAYYERGQGALALGRHEQALRDYGSAIIHDQRYAPAYIARGYARLVSGDIDGAIADYSRLLDLEPRNAVALNNRGLAWRKKGDADKALADFTASIAADGRYGLAYANRGYVHESRGNQSAARADFAKALALDPTLAAAGAGIRRLGGDLAAVGQSDRLVETGRALVESACVSCHATGKTDISANEQAPAFREIQDRYPILTLRDPVSRGIAFPHQDMPKFNFSGEQIDTIIAYIRSLPPNK
jgi:tetratricopeptide (TPR) repeat protein